MILLFQPAGSCTSTGDLLLIRSQREADRDGQIVVARVGGETLLKHIHVDEEERAVELIPANPDYDTLRIPFESAEEVEVQGVAVMKLSYL